MKGGDVLDFQKGGILENGGRGQGYDPLTNHVIFVQ